jgi:hypothetical protein
MLNVLVISGVHFIVGSVNVSEREDKNNKVCLKQSNSKFNKVEQMVVKERMSVKFKNCRVVSPKQQ